MFAFLIINHFPMLKCNDGGMFNSENNGEKTLSKKCFKETRIWEHLIWYWYAFCFDYLFVIFGGRGNFHSSEGLFYTWSWIIAQDKIKLHPPVQGSVRMFAQAAAWELLQKLTTVDCSDSSTILCKHLQNSTCKLFSSSMHCSLDPIWQWCAIMG